ncbi:hypothetical protein [Providencia huashanensis]|uniref:hypothetical protein n=1 Tax=Providencia huashanensis TaxID=3037798 RepID=UPI002ACC6177|nr:hypothetical protein [Providencia rettgeri]
MYNTKIYVAITIFYILAIIGYLFKVGFYGLLNEPKDFGSFLAGAFSPLAFMWLVFGYFLQKRELEQSTQALKIQAKELENSVEQTKSLAMTSLAQFNLLKEKHDIDVSLIRSINTPRFTMGFDSTGRTNNKQSCHLILYCNYGVAFNVKVKINAPININREYSVLSKESRRIDFVLDTNTLPQTVDVAVTYLTPFGEEKKLSWEYLYTSR